MVRSEPSALRWLIGVELARYRNAAQLSLSAASAATGISKPKLGHLETGRQQQDPDDIATLLRAYGAEQRDIDRLTSLTGRADDSTWWAPWAQVVPDWLKTFVGLEGLAKREFSYEPLVIPGMLQTEDYARAITNGTPRVRADHGERFVGFRMARTRRLVDQEKPLHLHAVIGEAALRLRVGTPELRRAQLQHLVDIAERSNVTIQVVRPEDGLHTAMTGPFVVLDFEHVRSIGYAELHDGAIYIQDPDQVHSCTLVAENLQRVALGPDQSIAFIHSMLNA
ncbi:helix-turn-helix domain-containing protein [Streptoalloteichus hindustanus]|uniref:Helix-turn-helix domain-containing protein n=1 Tax=Streptoalloteichus hindustanus TaxID=2017 RepID=A0A1M4TKT7_STRHI|nr:helix-turn-helix transcriptional regulator [Streptoalloteichus hindustanus]SHE44974.1 Helix-turn-helix domain-containing protein [Streptoalloteichus hindustanus]